VFGSGTTFNMGTSAAASAFPVDSALQPGAPSQLAARWPCQLGRRGRRRHLRLELLASAARLLRRRHRAAGSPCRGLGRRRRGRGREVRGASSCRSLALYSLGWRPRPAARTRRRALQMRKCPVHPACCRCPGALLVLAVQGFRPHSSNVLLSPGGHCLGRARHGEQWIGQLFPLDALCMLNPTMPPLLCC
jgi:hypothetical protein